MSDQIHAQQVLAAGEAISKKNANVHQSILDIAHLFFLYKARVEAKIAEVVRAAKKFESSVSTKLEELEIDIETADYMPDSMNSSLLRDLSIDEEQFRSDKRAARTRPTAKQSRRLPFDRPDKPDPESLRFDLRVKNLQGKAASDLSDAQRQLEDLLSLMKYRPERRGAQAPEYKDLVETVDVEDFLVLANHYFSRFKPQLDLQESKSDFANSGPQSRDGSLHHSASQKEESGLKQCLRRIADLQQLLKSKEQKLKDLQGTPPLTRPLRPGARRD